ncbi:hypothetical protein BGZ99_009790 [Dissophora globulifera]|uniref:Polysaccharide lyase 14 domain-containing protein n=1 Tax=Dissophora globulifera TaxID=979702 RepID=A0A9P6R625_9FUNG|nr:hypothetical protein BGZ99_009790 [Dissophora globulifera]
MPPSIADLKSALHLQSALIPNVSPFQIVSDPKIGSKRVLRSIYPAGSYSGSGDKHAAFTATPLSNNAFQGKVSRYVRLEYQLYFQPGFNWVKGGKLPGILVGEEKGCNGGCSGGGSAEFCFSTRMMWRANGGGEMYLYAAKSVYFPDQPPESCKRSMEASSPEALFRLRQRNINPYRIPTEADEVYMTSKGVVKRADGSCLNGMGVTISPGATNVCNPTYGISIGRGGKFQFKSGTWHNITQIVRVNSKGKAKRDGFLSVYLDGKQVIKATNLVFLKSGYDPSTTAPNHLVKLMFSSFFGGHTKDYATPTKQWIDWRGFKMTTSATNIWK